MLYFRSIFYNMKNSIRILIGFCVWHGGASDILFGEGNFVCLHCSFHFCTLNSCCRDASTRASAVVVEYKAAFPGDVSSGNPT